MIDWIYLFFFSLFLVAKENERELPGQKRAASKGRGRGSNQASKRGRKSDNSSIHRMLMNNDDDDDDDDDNVRKRLNKSQPRVCVFIGFLTSYSRLYITMTIQNFCLNRYWSYVVFWFIYSITTLVCNPQYF